MAIKQMAKAEGLATESDAIDLRATALIGIIGRSGKHVALLRNPDGSIEKVGRGEAARAGTVVGIDEKSVSLRKGARVTVLELPSS